MAERIQPDPSDLSADIERSGSESWWSSTLVRTLTLGLLALAPWAFGSVEPWARLILYIGFAAALAIWFVQLVRRPRSSLPLPLAALPILGGLGLGFLQTIPLPSSVLAVSAPGTSWWREHVLPASPEVVGLGDQQFSSRLPRPTVSLYPGATRSAILDLSLYLAAFLLGFQYFRRRQPQLWLCGVATAVGGAMALFGIVQWLSRTQRIYWVVDLSQGGGPFGPFVNRNNAGGFLNICLAASLGLLLYVTRPRHRHHEPDRHIHGSLRLVERLIAPLTDRFGDVSSIRMGLFAVTGLIVAAVLCTLSRGAFLAMTGGAAVTLLATLATKRSRGAAMFVSLGAAAALLIGWVGMTETVQKRLATLSPESEEHPYDRRLHWQDALSAVPDFWLLGSGLGTYRFVYPAYQREPRGNVFYHAENLYVETLLESGIVGFLLLMVALALVSAAAWEVTRTSGRGRASPLAFAGVFLIASQAIHSMADFGLYIPSNALWFAVFCGSVVGRAMLTRRSARAETRQSNGLGLAALLLPVGAGGLLILAVLGALDTADSMPSARALRDWRLSLKDPALSLTERIEKTIAELDAALPAAWTNAEVHQALAELYMARYRVEAQKALRSLTDTQSGPPLDPKPDLPTAANSEVKPGPPPTTQPDDLPEPSSVGDPLLVSARLQEMADPEREEARSVLEADLAVQRSLFPAVRHAFWTREFCLLLPRIEMHLAELSFLIRSGDPDAFYLDRARLLAPSDAGLWLDAGLLDWHAGRLEAACRSWRRSLELSGRYLVPILDRSTTGLARDSIMADILPEKPDILLAAAAYLYPSEDALAERRPLLEKALDLLAAQASPLTAEELWVKVGVHRQLGQTELAVQAYQAALARDPRQADCRYALADALYEQGRLQESLWQLQILLDGASGHSKACALLRIVTQDIAKGTVTPEGPPPLAAPDKKGR